MLTFEENDSITLSLNSTKIFYRLFLLSFVRQMQNILLRGINIFKSTLKTHTTRIDVELANNFVEKPE